MIRYKVTLPKSDPLSRLGREVDVFLPFDDPRVPGEVHFEGPPRMVEMVREALRVGGEGGRIDGPASAYELYRVMGLPAMADYAPRLIAGADVVCPPVSLRGTSSAVAHLLCLFYVRLVASDVIRGTIEDGLTRDAVAHTLRDLYDRHRRWEPLIGDGVDAIEQLRPFLLEAWERAVLSWGASAPPPFSHLLTTARKLHEIFRDLARDHAALEAVGSGGPPTPLHRPGAWEEVVTRLAREVPPLVHQGSSSEQP